MIFIELDNLIYSIRGVNPIKGEVFDRLGIVISTIDKIAYWENTKTKTKQEYIITTDKEVITKYFTTLGEAIKYLKECYLKCDNPRYLIYKNAEPCIIDNSILKDKQLTLFDFL